MTSPARRLLEIAIDANRPVLLMGAPGTAKTAMLEAIAAERGAYLEVLIASAQDPTTILGIPMPSEDRRHTIPTVPAWAQRVIDADAAGRPTILFIDELTTVPPSVAAPMLGVVQSRRADGWTLPADTRIVAAANPPDLAVGGWRLDPAMANRWCHIDWPAPVEEWTAWASAQDSPALKLIAEYIRAIPSEILNVPSDITKRSGPWPSPRSWTNAAGLIDQAGGDLSLAALLVGAPAAATFGAWAAARDVPTVQEMLDGAELPERQDAFVTALTNLANAVTDQTATRTIEILLQAVPLDPSVVAVAALTVGRSGHISGIAPLVAALQEAGIDLGAIQS